LITGFNTNVRYCGRVFHVQTEDSGTKNPHIISHLYHGGTILASERRDYAEHLESETLEQEVRSLMEAQHKAMLRRLKGAEYDALIAERLDGAAPAAAADGEAATSPSLVDAAPEADPAPGPAARAAAPRHFGEGLVSEKPLDEVILEYLVRKARDRGGRAAAGGSRPRPRSAAKG
jgi:hypothetical protein